MGVEQERKKRVVAGVARKLRVGKGGGTRVRKEWERRRELREKERKGQRVKKKQETERKEKKKKQKRGFSGIGKEE